MSQKGINPKTDLFMEVEAKEVSLEVMREVRSPRKIF